MKKVIALSLAILAPITPPLYALNTLYTHIASLYLPSIADEATISALPTSQDAFAVESLSEAQSRLIAFKILSQGSIEASLSYACLDTQAWENVELYSGANLLGLIKRTHTKLGEASLGGMLGKPITDIPELHRRQHIINSLINDPALFASLSKALQTVHDIEPTVLAFWKEESPLLQQAFKRLYVSDIFRGADTMNKSPSTLEFLRRLEDLGTFLLIPFAVLFIRHLFKNGTYDKFRSNLAKLRRPFSPSAHNSSSKSQSTSSDNEFPGDGHTWGPPTHQGSPHTQSSAHQHSPGHDSPPDDPQAYDTQANDALSDDAQLDAPDTPFDLGVQLCFDGSQLLSGLFNFPFAIYQVMQYHQFTYKSLQYLHTKLSYLAQALTKMREVQRTLFKHRDALASLHECQALHTLFTTHSTQDLDSTLNLLTSRTFKGNFSYFTLFGRILVANKLIETTKQDLIPALAAIGTLDAYVSLASLMQEFKNKRVTFCFATYVNKPLPSISLTEFWNPLMPATKVVTNDLELGTPEGHNIILTGQNTGGKSTVMKAIALNLILAQTCGIGAAKKLTITPFDYVSTYMNITDNVREGKSLFAAEVSRARELLEAVNTLKPHEKSFVIIDEAFKGTGSEAEGLSYWYAQQFLRYPNSMCINATHYPKLTRLERETKGFYQNYKVEVTVEAHGKLNRRFKLEKGYTLHNIAEHILVEQGLKGKDEGGGNEGGVG